MGQNAKVQVSTKMIHPLRTNHIMPMQEISMSKIYQNINKNMTSKVVKCIQAMNYLYKLSINQSIHPSIQKID